MPAFDVGPSVPSPDNAPMGPMIVSPLNVPVTITVPPVTDVFKLTVPPKIKVPAPL